MTWKDCFSEAYNEKIQTDCKFVSFFLIHLKIEGAEHRIHPKLKESMTPQEESPGIAPWGAASRHQQEGGTVDQNWKYTVLRSLHPKGNGICRLC